MPANFSPIFPLVPNAGINNALLTTAMVNTAAYDGTTAAGTAMREVFTAGVNGARLDDVRVQFASTNGAAASGTTAATLVRLWLNNGSANTTATNNQLLGEIAVGATTLTALSTAINPIAAFSPNRSIPPGWKVFAGLTVAIGGTNCALLVTASGGDY